MFTTESLALSITSAIRCLSPSEAYRAEGGTEKIPAYVEDTGEVPIPVISQAVMQLFASRDDKKNWARAIAMMRHGFGGHPYGPSEAEVLERRGGRIGSFLREYAEAPGS